MRRNAVGSSEENAEGRTAYEQQLTELEWAVEDGEEYLRVEKKKGEAHLSWAAPTFGGLLRPLYLWNTLEIESITFLLFSVFK